MPLIESLRHVLKNSMGLTYCIWYKNGLFMSMLENDNKWGPPFLLSENATSDFSSSIDSGDTIRTAFVDYMGRLLYISACEEKKEPTILLESRVAGSSPYNVTLLATPAYSHVFYTVSHNRKQLLTYQRIENASYSMPEVEGVIVKDSKNYTVCFDGSVVHLFFLTEIQDVNLIVHRQIGEDGKAMKPNSAPFPYKVSKRLQSVLSKNGIISILASHDDDNESTLLLKFDTINNKFSKGLEVFNLSTPLGFDSLIMVNNTPSIIRTCKNHFLLARVKSDLSSIIGEIKIDLAANNVPLKCKYLSTFKEDQGFTCDEVPILFGSGFRLPFDWKSMASDKYDKPADEKILLQDRMKELEGRVEFLENTLREILRP